MAVVSDQSIPSSKFRDVAVPINVFLLVKEIHDSPDGGVYAMGTLSMRVVDVTKDVEQDEMGTPRRKVVSPGREDSAVIDGAAGSTQAKPFHFIVKTPLQDSSGTSEVLRLRVERSSIELQRLQHKVAKELNLRGPPTLAYVDDEGDRISIRSEGELQEAVDAAQRNGKDRLSLHATPIKVPKEFVPRVNEARVPQDFFERRRKPVLFKAKDDEGTHAWCTTYNIGLPLKFETIFDHYPFRLQCAYVKLDFQTQHEDGLNFRPDVKIVRHERTGTDENCPEDDPLTYLKPASGVAMHRFDQSAQYDFASDEMMGFVYGKRDDDRTSTLMIGFLLSDPPLVACINMLAPITLILVLLSSNTSDDELDKADYRQEITALATALVFALPQMRRKREGLTRVTSADLFIILVVFGFSFSCVSAHYWTLRCVGVGIAWAAMLLPIFGWIRYQRLLYILHQAHREDDKKHVLNHDVKGQRLSKAKASEFRTKGDYKWREVRCQKDFMKRYKKAIRSGAHVLIPQPIGFCLRRLQLSAREIENKDDEPPLTADRLTGRDSPPHLHTYHAESWVSTVTPNAAACASSASEATSPSELKTSITEEEQELGI